MAEENSAGPSTGQTEERQPSTEMDTQPPNAGTEAEQREVEAEITSESDDSSWEDFGHCEGCSCEKKGKEFDVSGPMKLKHWKNHGSEHFGKHVMKRMKKFGKHGFKGCLIEGKGPKHHGHGPKHGLGHGHPHHGPDHPYHGHGRGHGHHGPGHHHGRKHHVHGPRHDPGHHHEHGHGHGHGLEHHRKGFMAFPGEMDDVRGFMLEKKMMKKFWKKHGHGGEHGHKGRHGFKHGHEMRGHGQGKHGHHHGFGHGHHGFHGLRHFFGARCASI